MKLLMFAASLRKDSSNKKLIKLAAELAKKQGVDVDLADFSEFTGTLYNADIQESAGFPKEISHFTERLKSADGLIIASPEYNFSTPGTLKNLIDWVSRITPMPWKGHPVLLMSASPAFVGGNRGLWSTRIPLESCGSHVFPEMFSLANAYAMFDEKGQLVDNQLQERLAQNVKDFIQFVPMIKQLK